MATIIAPRSETHQLEALSNAPGEVLSIQYLRGLAAVGVLLLHAADRGGYVFDVGAAGVDIFFVISGFIMWVVTCRKSPLPGEFLVRRVQRIVPLYWGVTLVTAAAALLLPGAFPAMRATAGHVVQSLLFIPHRGETGMIAPLIVPGWTLNYEMFFYLLFAATLRVPARMRPWMITTALVGLVAIRPLSDAANPFWDTYTNPLLLEFGAGVWLGKAWSDGGLPRRTIGWLLVGAGFAGFTISTFAGFDVVGPARVVLWGLPALALVAGAVSLERAGPLPRWWPLRVLGDASYSVYLIHGLAISAAFRFLQKMGVANAIPLFMVSAGVVAGILAYHLVEQPITNLFRTGLAADPPILSIAAVAAPSPKA